MALDKLTPRDVDMISLDYGGHFYNGIDVDTEMKQTTENNRKLIDENIQQTTKIKALNSLIKRVTQGTSDWKLSNIELSRKAIMEELNGC